MAGANAPTGMACFTMRKIVRKLLAYLRTEIKRGLRKIHDIHHPHHSREATRRFAGLVASDKGFEYPIEEARGQEAVVVAVAVREFVQVIAGPEKLVALGDDDP